jgi:hypothetical protein
MILQWIIETAGHQSTSNRVAVEVTSITKQLVLAIDTSPTQGPASQRLM